MDLGFRIELVNQHGVYAPRAFRRRATSRGQKFFRELDRFVGNLWLFGGSGYISSGPSGGLLNDLWEYSNGQWTWMSGFPESPVRAVRHKRHAGRGKYSRARQTL